MKHLTRRRHVFDVWPGFVDALTSLIMVMIFVLLIFAIGQAVLSDALAGKSRALDAVNARAVELAKSLALREDATHRQEVRINELAQALDQAGIERERLGRELDSAAGRQALLRTDIAALSELKRQLESEVARLSTESQVTKQELVKQTDLTAAALAQVELQSRQAAAIREQLGKLAAALDVSGKDGRDKDLKIADLDRQLNLALANQVSKLERYRSEFFGKLRESLGNRSDVRVVGDRFVLPTDVLFESGSADLGPEAQGHLSRLVATIKEVGGGIPNTIDWVLRIDGHTDKVPIHTDRFPSNWELSTARAVEIVKYLIALGIPPNRLSANGFGQFQPLDGSDNPVAYAKNRRIELQLTNR